MVQTNVLPADVGVLSDKQVKAAKALREKRPMCYPGTNVIIANAERKQWYEQVTQVAIDMDVKPDQSTAFFNVCGVPD